VLLPQGGGALGSFQAGVYQAMAEANLHPDWVAGISIGATLRLDPAPGARLIGAYEVGGRWPAQNRMSSSGRSTRRAVLVCPTVAGLSDRAVIDRYLMRVIVRRDSIDIELREPTLAPEPLAATDASVIADVPASYTCTPVINLPWTAQAFPSIKGVLHQPKAKPTLKQETRDAILLAVAKARSWIDDLASDRVRSFAEREGKVERHIRLLTPLAFIPPRKLVAIIYGTGHTMLP
jgi:hypothetical protein